MQISVEPYQNITLNSIPNSLTNYHVCSHRLLLTTFSKVILIIASSNKLNIDELTVVLEANTY